MAPTKVEALWTAIVTALNKLVQQPMGSPQFMDNSAKITGAMLALKKVAAYTPREWDTVVNKLQVPRHLFNACARAAGQHDSAPSDRALYKSLLQPVEVLDLFVNARKRHEHNSGGMRSPGIAQYNQSILLQLQQSGLLDKLPALLSTVAAELARAAGATDAERQQLQGLTMDTAGRVQREKTVQSRDVAEQLLGIVMWLTILPGPQLPQSSGAGPSSQLGLGSAARRSPQQPVGSITVMSPQTTLAHMELVLAVARDVSRSLEELGPGDCPDPGEFITLGNTLSKVQVLSCQPDSLEGFLSSAAACQGSAPRAPLEQVLLSPAVVPCLSMVLAFTMYSQTAAEQRQRNAAAATSASSSRNSRAAPSSGSGQQLIRTKLGPAWQQANQALATLPACHHQLSAALGLDPRMLLTLAAIDMSSLAYLSSQESVLTIAKGLVGVYSQVMRVSGQGKFDHLWRQKPAAQQQLELQLQLLLSGVLLDCATRIPTSSPGHGEYGLLAAQSAYNAIAAWSHLSRLVGGTELHHGSCSSQQPQQQLPGPWVAEVLPAAIKLARRVVPALQADADIANAADAAAQGGSSGNAAGSAAVAAAAASLALNASEAGGDSALGLSSSQARAACLYQLLGCCGKVCGAVVPPGSLGPPAAASGAVSFDEFFNVSQDFMRNPIYATQWALIDSLFGGSGNSPASTASQASSSSASAAPRRDPALDGTSVIVGGAVHMLRVLEGFMRTAAATPHAVCAANVSSPPDLPLIDWLEHATLPSANRMLCNPEHNCQPAARCLLQLACLAGAGSPMQRAVYSVLSTTVKLCFLQHSNQRQGVLEDAGRCLLLAAEAAAYLLKTSLSVGAAAGDASPAGSLAPAGSTGPAGGTASSHSGADTAPEVKTPASAATAVQLLPSLVIFGRMCLLFADQLPPKISHLVAMQEIKVFAEHMTAARYMQLMDMHERQAPRNGVVDVMWGQAPGGVTESKFDLILQACLEWLQDNTVAAQLSAAGYDLPLLQQLQALAAALKAARDDDTLDVVPFEVLAQQLQETGKLLCSLAVPLHCNNPLCTNISRTLEVSLVSGHSTKCSICRVAKYCDRRCQKVHWKQHKAVCEALQAAAAAASAAPTKAAAES